MTRNDLSPEKQKEYDSIVKQLMDELEALPGYNNPGDRLDSGKIPGQKEIEDKYFPQLFELLGAEK